ncbi:hypothetical protein JVU11DRAFT_6687 [Chiua virens]|nr:hypothetical protein JVU11DRAFT_6687 [Chiua virens]
MDANSLAPKLLNHPNVSEESTRFKAPVAQRSGLRYKEKFQSLREKFDQVNALHDEYQRDLDLANTRIQRLQAENDLLLDAISITGTCHAVTDASYPPIPDWHLLNANVIVIHTSSAVHFDEWAYL